MNKGNELWTAKVKVARSSPHNESFALPEGKYKFSAKSDISGPNPLNNVKIELILGSNVPLTLKLEASKTDVHYNFDISNNNTPVSVKFSTGKMMGGISVTAVITTREGGVSNSLLNVNSISTPPLSSSQFEQKLQKSESSLGELLDNQEEENKNNNSNNSNDQYVTMGEENKEIQNGEIEEIEEEIEELEEDIVEDPAEDEKWEKEMEKLEEELKEIKDFYWAEKAEVVHSTPTIHNVSLTKGSYRLILKKRELNPRKGFTSQISILTSTKQLIKKESTTIIKKYQFYIISFEILESQAPATVTIQSIAIKHKIANAPVKMTAIIERVTNSPAGLSPKSTFTKMPRTLDSTNSKLKITEKIKYLKQRGTPSPSVNSDSDSESSSSSSDLLADKSNIVVEEGNLLITYLLFISSTRY